MKPHDFMGLTGMYLHLSGYADDGTAERGEGHAQKVVVRWLGPTPPVSQKDAKRGIVAAYRHAYHQDEGTEVRHFRRQHSLTPATQHLSSFCGATPMLPAARRCCSFGHMYVPFTTKEGLFLLQLVKCTKKKIFYSNEYRHYHHHHNHHPLVDDVSYPRSLQESKRGTLLYIPS